MQVDGPFPFRGEVIWLTPEQGGRRKGVPRLELADGRSIDYAHVAHVPPETIETGSASFVLRGFDHGLWRSPAEGRWLLCDNAGPQRIVPGSVVAVTEGADLVAYFVVTEVDEDE